MDKRVQVIAALWFFQVANYFDRVAISFAGPSIMKSLAIEPSSFGIILSSFGVGYFLGQIPGGVIADRWGAKWLLVIAPVFWALFTGATGFVATVTGFVVVRACFGLSEGLSNAACFKVIGDLFPPRQRALVAGIWATAFAVAPATAGPVVGVLLASVGWQAVFLVLAIPALLAALLNYFFIPAGGQRSSSVVDEPKTHPSLAATLRLPSLWLISLGYLSFNIAYWGYLGWMPSYLALAHHIDVKSIGILGGIPYVFAFFGLLITGWLGSSVLYRYRPQLLACCYVLAAVSLGFAYTSDTLFSSLAGLSGAAFFLYGGLAPYGAIVLDLAPENNRAAYSGIVNSAGQIGGAVAPLIIGFLVSASGTFASGFAFMVGGLALGAICVLGLVPFMPARPLPTAATAVAAH